MYAIIGASGHTGSVVADELLKNGQKVRVIGRNAVHLKRFAEKGAEVFTGSVENSDDMVRAFTGVDAVYAMIPPNMGVSDFRAYQNRVIDAVVKGIERAGVKYVVVLSSIGGQHAEGVGPVKGLHDFEERLKKLKGVNVLVLRPGFFMENTLGNIPLIEKMGLNGGAVKPDLPIPMIAAKDVGSYAAKRLLAKNYSGYLIQDLMGPRDLTWNEITRIIGAAIGKPDLKYVQFPYQDAVQGMVTMGLPKAMAESYIELSRAANEGLLKPERPRSAESTTPTTFEEFAKTFAIAYEHN